MTPKQGVSREKWARAVEALKPFVRAFTEALEHKYPQLDAPDLKAAAVKAQVRIVLKTYRLRPTERQLQDLFPTRKPHVET